MKVARLVVTAVAVAVTGTWAWSYACDHAKTSAVAASASKSGVCTAEMAKHCTPEMAAACAAKGHGAKSAAAGDHCAMKGTKASAVTAANGHCDMKRAKTSATSAANEHGAARGATATTASAKGAKRVRTAAMDDCCAGKGAGAAAAALAQPVRVDAVLAGASCHGEGMTTAAGRGVHENCDACADLTACNEQLEAAGATMQVVPIKNGVMYVYTASSPAGVRSVQAAMARRNQRMAEIASAGENVKLCAECKAMRGAAASGKLVREVVNIEGGVLTMMTSSDAAMVSRIHQLAGVQTSARVKS